MLAGDIFEVIKDRNILLHQPYDSFNPVVDFLKAAARDPDVLAIKQTLYRVGRNSPVVDALLEARDSQRAVAPLMIALVIWLVVIFLGFTILAPANVTSTLALIAGAFSVAEGVERDVAFVALAAHINFGCGLKYWRMPDMCLIRATSCS